MKELEVELLLHKTIEYDAQDGEDKYRVTMTTQWMNKKDFQRLVAQSDVGSVTATIRGDDDRPNQEAAHDQR